MRQWWTDCVRSAHPLFPSVCSIAPSPCSARSTGPPAGDTQRILVVFVGGMTYGEASCVRFLGKLLRKEMVILTTDTITGNDAAAAFDARASQQA